MARHTRELVAECAYAACEVTRDELGMSSLRPELIVHDTVRGLMLKVRAVVWTERLPDETVELRVKFSQPANWWEHFKLERMPAWFTERFPVRWKHEVHERATNLQSLARLVEFAYVPPSGSGRAVFVWESTPPLDRVRRYP